MMFDLTGKRARVVISSNETELCPAVDGGTLIAN
jgi:hypothetical protein